MYVEGFGLQHDGDVPAGVDRGRIVLHLQRRWTEPHH